MIVAYNFAMDATAIANVEAYKKPGTLARTVLVVYPYICKPRVVDTNAVRESVLQCSDRLGRGWLVGAQIVREDLHVAVLWWREGRDWSFYVGLK